MRMETIRISASVDGAMLENGYQPKTTFWMDFSIADRFGTEAIVDTYERAFKEWYEKNDAIARVYDKLWRKADEWAQENLHGKELQYFYEVTD